MLHAPSKRDHAARCNSATAIVLDDAAGRRSGYATLKKGTPGKNQHVRLRYPPPGAPALWGLLGVSSIILGIVRWHPQHRGASRRHGWNRWGTGVWGIPWATERYLETCAFHNFGSEGRSSNPSGRASFFRSRAPLTATI